VFSFHKEMVEAFEYQDDQTAAEIMARMLDHGAEHLKASQ
jgi:DNA-binding FadR family transcriptional regulator